MTTARHWIKKLRLRPHPEGGYFRETFRSKESIPASALPKRFKGRRAFSTAIYFLITKGRPSHPHRIQSDEIWHFYDGGSLVLAMESPRGTIKKIRMGKTGALQAVVPAGWWMSAHVARGSCVLVGCTVAPGFDFQELELR
jgi:predicted cupin superfamily sugar epimerase